VVGFRRDTSKIHPASLISPPAHELRAKNAVLIEVPAKNDVLIERGAREERRFDRGAPPRAHKQKDE
jgi:hypothetical protein